MHFLSFYLHDNKIFMRRSAPVEVYWKQYCYLVHTEDFGIDLEEAINVTLIFLYTNKIIVNG